MTDPQAPVVSGEETMAAEPRARPIPPLEWERAPCPACGAVTVNQAATKCRPRSDETGESNCPGAVGEDSEGFLTQPTPESLAALDRWCGEEMQREREG